MQRTWRTTGGDSVPEAICLTDLRAQADIDLGLKNMTLAEIQLIIWHPQQLILPH
ncbi:MAG: hypothetical protein FWF71_04205 [Actinomycetia bacterium]|nr:hypothetical protein [Actinomycetes bacterium]